MQALPAWHLYGFRRSLCNSALLYQPLNPRWQRRAPGAPVFGARAADNAPTGKTKDAAAISKQRDRLQPTKDRKRQVATVKRRGNRIRSWDPLAGVSEPRTTRNRETKSDNKPRKQSLLEELFPEETNGHGKAAKRAAKTREIPRRPMGFTSTGFEEEMPTPDVKPREHKQYHDSHVLVMKNGPKCLLEEDFRRLVPGGGHLEGWNSVGDLMKGALFLSRRFRLRRTHADTEQSFEDATRPPSVLLVTTIFFSAPPTPRIPINGRSVAFFASVRRRV